MTFIRRTGGIVTPPAGMLGVIQVETEHFKRVSADLCGHFVAISCVLLCSVGIILQRVPR